MYVIVHVLHVTSSTYRAVHVVDVADVEILVWKADDTVYVLQLKQRSHYSIAQTNTALQYTVVLWRHVEATGTFSRALDLVTLSIQGMSSRMLSSVRLNLVTILSAFRIFSRENEPNNSIIIELRNSTAAKYAIVYFQHTRSRDVTLDLTDWILESEQYDKSVHRLFAGVSHVFVKKFSRQSWSQSILDRRQAMLPCRQVQLLTC